MRYSFFISLLLIIFLVPFSISAQNSENKNNDPDKDVTSFREKYSLESREKVFNDNTGSSNPNGESSIDIDFPLAETPPVNIVRNVLRPKKEGNFYKNDSIEIVIKLTSQKKDGLRQIEFWEIPGDNLSILQCFYHIRTSDIQKMLDYENRNESYLQKNDIKNVTGILKSLKNNQSSDAARERLNKYLYDQLSNDTVSLIKKTNTIKINETLQEWLKENLTKDFNEILSNESTDLLEYFRNSSFNIDRKRVSSLNPASSDYLDLCDYRLQKRLMLEHIYSNMLINLSFLKKHERNTFVKEYNAIRLVEENLRKGETIIFRYWLRPTDLGLKEIRYILRADGYLQEGVATFNVSEKGEKFLIDYRCDSKDITENREETFTYSIEYLGGNEESHSFPVTITPPKKRCQIKSVSWEDESKPEKEFIENSLGEWSATRQVRFSKGITEKLNVSAVYNKTGLRVSPPTIKIGDYTKLFETELSVYSSYDDPFIIHYQFLTILLTIAAIIISLIIAVFSSFELYLANKEMKLIRKEIEITNKQLNLANSDRIEASKLKEKEIEIFEKLSRIINKILGD